MSNLKQERRCYFALAYKTFGFVFLSVVQLCLGVYFQDLSLQGEDTIIIQDEDIAKTGAHATDL